MSANWSSAPLQPLRVSRTSTLLAEYQPCSPADTALGDSILHLHFPIVAEYTLRAAISSAPVARHRVPLEAEYEGEGDRGYDGGGYDDRLRVDGPEQVAAVAVGCRGCGGGATGDASGTGDTPPWCRLEGNGVAGEAARRRKEAERQEAAAGQRRAAMGWEKSWRTIR